MTPTIVRARLFKINAGKESYYVLSTSAHEAFKAFVVSYPNLEVESLWSEESLLLVGSIHGQVSFKNFVIAVESQDTP